jgi:DNA-binding CsgD family transcriptional regulator
MSRRGRPPYPDTLTPRQQEVLELLREGLTNREIAERLDISTDGAKFHVSEILTRIGVTSRDDAVRWAEGPRERATASLGARIPRWPSRRLRARLKTQASAGRRGTAGPGCGRFRHRHTFRRLAA